MEKKAPGEAEREPIDPEDDSSIVDDFVQALLQDAQARTPSLAYSRQPDDSFICESFGISETRIVLKKDFETDHNDQYTVSLEYPDGSEVISCTEACELSAESNLRVLYNLVSQQYPETYQDKENRPVRACRWSSCLSRVANSWTTWPADVYGPDVDMNSKTVLTRIATLIVAAVLCDQLK